MTLDDYKALLELQKKAEEAQKTAHTAGDPWRAAALEIARDRTDVPVSEVFFKEDRIEYLCHGTGIYSEEEWIESYPIAMLFQKLGVLL